MKMKRAFSLLFAILLTTAIALGQLDRGSITGTVTDSSGALIPGVAVTIQNAGTGATYKTETTATGQFTMPNLPVGTYDLFFESIGFNRLVQRGVQLSVAEVRRVNAELEVGAVSESVEVTAELPRLATDTPEVSTNLESKNMAELPLAVGGGGRTAEEFAYKLAPGVSGGTWRGFVVGSTAFSKETVLDGATVSLNRAGHFGEMSISMEAMQEFKIQTSGVSAEYGRSQGSVFNYVMKSGTNEIHGSAYGMIRNEALNANTFANNARGAPRAQDRRWDYAFSFGGPVYIPKVYNGKNKTFFYTAYEVYHEGNFALGSPSRTAPIPDFYEGDFSRLLGPATQNKDALGRTVYQGAIYDPTTFRQVEGGRWVGEMFPNNTIPKSMFSRVSQNVNAIMQKHYLPTERDANGLFKLENNMPFLVQGIPVRDQWQFSTKGDHIINDFHKVSGSISYNLRPRLTAQPGGNRTLWDPDAEDGLGGPLSRARSQRLTTYFYRAAWDWTVKPTLLNHFVAYYNRFRNDNSNSHRNINGAAEIGLQGIDSNGYPDINMTTGPFVRLSGLGSSQESNNVDNVWGLVNTTSFSRGKHFIKFGVDWKHNLQVTPQFPQPQVFFEPRATAIPNEPYSGNQTGYAMASYLLGIVDRASLADPVGRGYFQDYIGLFVQDDFKLRPNLTLNLGMRWDTLAPVREKHDRLSSWSPAEIDPVSGLPGAMQFAGDCDLCTGRDYFGSYDLNNFAPRIGIAYRPNDKMTVRASYGIFFEAQATNGQPIGKSGFSAWGGTFVLGADPIEPWRGIFNWDDKFPTSEVFQPGGFDRSWGNDNAPGMFDEDHGIMPYVQKWNFNLQFELARNLVLDVGYLGTKGTSLRAGELRVINQITPADLAKFGSDLTTPVRSQADADKFGIAYPYEGFRGTVASALRTFPQVRGNSVINSRGAALGFSNTHSMQVTLDKRFSNGLTAYLNYTWSKTLSNVFSSVEGEDGNKPLDYYNLALEKSIVQSDIPHMVKAYVAYELPFGRSKRWGSGWHSVTDAVLGGWSVSAILNYFSGNPLLWSGSSVGNNWNGRGRRINIGPGEMTDNSFSESDFDFFNTSAAGNTYLNKSIFSDITPGTLGTSAFAYPEARGFGTVNEDFGLQKNHRINEKFRIQIRAEFLNVFNRHFLGGINTNVTSGLFGQVTSVSGNRTIQLGARLDF